MNEAEIHVVCEGFHDRHFLTGFAARHGWKGPERIKDGTFRPMKDPSGKSVNRGRFGFYRGDRFLHLIPVRGDTTVLAGAEPRLQGRHTGGPLRRVVVCLDADTIDDAGLQLRRAQFRSWSEALGATLQNPDAAELDGVELRLLVWRTLDSSTSTGVPPSHSLERVVATALSRATPERGSSVQDFIASSADPAGGKEHAWAYMARWYADRGCENFYEAVWEDPALRATLDPIADAIGLRAALDDP